MSLPNPSSDAPPLAPSRVLTAAAGAGAGAVNTVLALCLVAVLDVSADFRALQLGPVLFASVVGVVAGAVTFRTMHRLRGTSVTSFRPWVVGATALSLGGPASLLLDGSSFAGTTTAAALALVPLHVVPAVALLVALGREREDRS